MPLSGAQGPAEKEPGVFAGRGREGRAGSSERGPALGTLPSLAAEGRVRLVLRGPRRAEIE